MGDISPAKQQTILGVKQKMSNEKYNGWTNRATWTANLWLNEDQDSLREYWEIDGLLERINDGEDKFKVMRQLSKTIEEYIDDMIDTQLESTNLLSSMTADLLHGAIAQINFDEIADHWLES